MADLENSTKKKISELRVIDLRNELEKRGLDRSGVKNALLERLNKSLEDEGLDPEEFLFDMSGDVVKTPVKSPVKRASRKPKDEAEVDSVHEDCTEDDEDKQEETLPEIIELDKEEEESGASKDEKISKRSDLFNGKKEPASADRVDAAPETTVPVISKPETIDQATAATNQKSEEDTSTDISTPSKSTEKDSDGQTPADNAAKLKDKETLEQSTDLKSGEKTPKKDAGVNVVEQSASEKNPEKIQSDPVTKNVDGGKSEEQTVTVEEPAKEKSVEKAVPTATTSPVKSSSSPVKRAKGSAEKVKRVSGNVQNLWVTGLAGKTKAVDLKTLFSKYGKVLGAKIVTNAKMPGSHRYGFVTMATSKEAAACIQHLQKTELNGRMITVETTSRKESFGAKRSLSAHANKSVPKKTPDAKKTQPAKEEKKETEKEKPDTKKDESKTASGEKSDNKEVAKSESDEAKKTDEASEDSKTAKKRSSSKNKSPRSARDSSSRERKRVRRSRTRSRSRSRGRFDRFANRRGGTYNNNNRAWGYNRGAFNQPRPFFNRFNRDFDRDREPERRPFYDNFRQDDIERRNREESQRLKREKDRLRQEREELERARAEVLRLEKEKQRDERERLERERAELRRRTQTIHLDERRGTRRGYDTHGTKEDDPSWEDRKRTVVAVRSPPRFSERESRSSYSDRRTERFDSRGKASDYPTSSSRRDSYNDSEKRNMSHGSRSSDIPDRRPSRDDWKSSKPREGSYERSRGARPGFAPPSDRSNPGYERPSPWNSDPVPPPSAPRSSNRFPAESSPGGQWGPVNKAENWNRLDEPSVQERWVPMDPIRNPPSIGMGHHPQSVPHPPNPMGMFQATNQMIHNIPGNFPGERYNISNVRQY